MSYFLIDGIVADAMISSIVENTTFEVGENEGRLASDGAPMFLDRIGTMIGHTLTIARINGKEQEFADLREYLSMPRNDFFEVSLPHGQGMITYNAFCEVGDITLKRIDTKTGVRYWDAYDVTFIPETAQITPQMARTFLAARRG